MPTTIAHNRYGKSSVRMVKLIRDAAVHEVKEITVDIGLEGDFEAAHLAGDNRSVLPTDTMKNTVYALGRDHPLDTIEAFALLLGRHFISGAAPISSARIEIAAHPWRHATCRGTAHPHAFIKGDVERETCRVVVYGDGHEITGGLADLLILKTARSGFVDFLHDDLTSLADTDDRLLGTALGAEWSYRGANVDFAACRRTIRAALVDAFCEHDSLSVQHTLYAMGDAALEACASISRIHLSMPNKHCLLVDLSPFGLANDNQVFVPVDEPFGLIEATLERS